MAEQTVEFLARKVQELEKALKDKDSKIEDYKVLMKLHGLDDASEKYKDKLFRFIFGNPENKQWTLSLYNALNNTRYENPDELVFNTIGDAMYMRMKNDISFLISFEMHLWEHQSTYNPNMPMRFFIYGGRLYEKYILTSDYYEYSSKLQKIPRPKCVCFYNGTKDQPERQVLKLSDAYDGDGSFEALVEMVNINYGKNKELMDACEPLQEYAWLVDVVRTHQTEGMDLELAVDAALKQMPDGYVIKGFLLANQAEVKNMFLSDYNEQKVLEKERNEGRDEERERRDKEIVSNLLKEGFDSVPLISRIAAISEDAVRAIAKNMNIML
jgi:predicted HTH domain antitoxin